MATTLPKYVIIQSNFDNRYLRLEPENEELPDALRYGREYSFGLDTRFEVVKAVSERRIGLVHIRSSQNNKCWANFGGEIGWVGAIAVKSEENWSDPDFTLSKPVFLYSNNNRVLKLRHVYTGRYVGFFTGTGLRYDTLCTYSGYSGLLSLTASNDEAVCTFLNWENTFRLPTIIQIKGDNGNHLKASADGFMDLKQKADSSSFYDFAVCPSRDGGIRLKSAKFGTYWKCPSRDGEIRLKTAAFGSLTTVGSWVLLKQPSNTTTHDTDTVFLPMVGEGGRITLKCLRTGLFCKRFTDVNVGKECFLAALDSYSDDYSYMEIEEPVISRKIYDIIYHLTDAKLYNGKTHELVTDDLSNRTEHPFTSEVNPKTTVSNTTSWRTTIPFTVGAKTSITIGFPFIQSGKLEISAEVTRFWDWGETVTESLGMGSVKTITVPPMTRLKVTLMATRCSYQLPFSCTQREVLKNGTTEVSKKKDGLISGDNGYAYSTRLCSFLSSKAHLDDDD